VKSLSTKRQVQQAVKELNSRLTVADVVASTGLSPLEITPELNALAAQTRASLEVTNAGEIYYCFPANLTYTFFAERLKKVIFAAALGLIKAVFYVLKLSFGIMLIGSLIIIFGIILLYQTMFASWFGNTETVGKIWGDFFALLKTCVFRNLITFKSGATSDGSPKQQGFLLDCFSFLFGDGNPNEHIEEERWKMIAQVIRLNEGVIVSEHLAPYTGRDASDLPTIFQVLAKFGGQAILSPSGQLLYVFPSMIQRSTNVTYAFMPSSVTEHAFHFSNLTKEQMMPVITLAAGNFLGAVMIFTVVHAHLDARLPLWFTALCVYATLFIVFPAVRWVLYKYMNNKIRERNARVAYYEEELGRPDETLQLKLKEAEAIRQESYAITDSTKVVYRTNKDYLEQAVDELGDIAQ
jgi:hypothetical protein